MTSEKPEPLTSAQRATALRNSIVAAVQRRLARGAPPEEIAAAMQIPRRMVDIIQVTGGLPDHGTGNDATPGDAE